MIFPDESDEQRRSRIARQAVKQLEQDAVREYYLELYRELARTRDERLASETIPQALEIYRALIEGYGRDYRDDIAASLAEIAVAVDCIR